MSTFSKPVAARSAPGHLAIQPQVPLRVSPARLEHHVQRYLYPFQLALTPHPDATGYLLAVSDVHGGRHEISSEEPVVSLTPIWEKLACGFVRTNAIARLADGSEVNFGHGFTFFKASPFDPGRRLPAKDTFERVIDGIFDSLTSNDLPDNYDPQSLPLIWHCVVHAERPRFYRKAYPGLHYPNYLEFFRLYERLRPERATEARKAADQVAGKAMEFVTPKEAVWPGLPYSTISQGKMGGDQEGGGEIQPLKAAKLGAAMFDYGKATGNVKAAEFALQVGETLAHRQYPSGGLPFRIRIDEAEAEASESSNLIYAVELWDRLEREQPGRFQKPLKKALDWLLQGPVQSQEWMATFEDVPSSRAGPGSGNYNHSDASCTARYLLSNREGNPDYLDLARKIDRWIEEGFVFYAEEHPLDFLRFPCPAVMEQAGHYYPINSHLADYAVLQLALFNATKETLYLEKARAMGNALTHYVTAKGELLTYAPDPDVGYGISDTIWFGCSATAGLALLRLREVGEDAMTSDSSLT